MVTKPFRILYAPHIREHLMVINRKYHLSIRKAIEELLCYEPDVKSTNRKPLKFSSQYGEWELRFGEKNRFRVIYRFSTRSREVFIGAIGEKRGDRLFVGGEEVKL